VKPTDVQTEIQAAVTTLQLAPEQFRQLADVDAEPIYRAALSRFVNARYEPRWWWEYLQEPQVGIYPQDIQAFALIPELVPDADAPLYFVAEDDPAPYYPVYFATTRNAMAVVRECSYFEYYLFPPDFSWLIGENHHEVVFGTGEPIVRAIKTRSGEIQSPPQSE
jgi:hypothetical protein